eukprot:2183444-Heterocapsa_arctica.AAC.1
MLSWSRTPAAAALKRKSVFHFWWCPIRVPALSSMNCAHHLTVLGPFTTKSGKTSSRMSATASLNGRTRMPFS